MTTWNVFQGEQECGDRNSTIQPLIQFQNGQQNELVLIRACAVVDPFSQRIGVGRSMRNDSSGGYQVQASSAS